MAFNGIDHLEFPSGRSVISPQSPTYFGGTVTVIVRAVMSTKGKRHSTRRTVCDDLDLGYPLEKFRGAESPRNKDILLHIFFFLRVDVKGGSDVNGAILLVVESLKKSWHGSNVKLATDKVLKERLLAIYDLYR